MEFGGAQGGPQTRAAALSHRLLRVRGCRTGSWTREREGSPPSPVTSSLHLLSVPSLLLGNFPIYWSLEESVWLAKFLAELCLPLQSPAEPNLLGSCYLRGFLLVFCCSFLSQSPTLTTGFFKTRVWGSVLLLSVPSCSREKAHIGKVPNSRKPLLFPSENRENTTFHQVHINALAV